MYTEYLQNWPSSISRKVRCLAARWYCGVEDANSIIALTQHNYVIDNEPDFRKTVYQKPVLTIEERDEIFRLVGWCP